MRARNYDALKARWLSRDPLFWPLLDVGPGDVDIIAVAGLFSYVQSLPTTNVDPSGLLEVEFIPGRFEIFNGRPSPAAGNWASIMFFDAKSIPGSFSSRCGVKCERIGYVQIEKSRLDLRTFNPNGITALWLLTTGNSNWGLDGWIPYQEAQPRLVYPPFKMPTFITFIDNPGIDSLPWGVQLRVFRQEFEVHLVCLAGLEVGKTYGGYKWGHTFMTRDYAAYRASRWSHKLGSPSDVFKEILTEELGKLPVQWTGI